MPIVTKIIKEIVKDEPFYNCKKCDKKGTYDKNKILCDDCFKKQKEQFKED